MRFEFKDNAAFRNLYPYNRLQLQNYARSPGSPLAMGVTSKQPVNIRRMAVAESPPTPWAETQESADVIVLVPTGFEAVGGTFTLMAGSNFSRGHTVIVKEDQGLENNAVITIAPNGSDTIDGGSSATIITSYAAMIFTWDGTSNWQVY